MADQPSLTGDLTKDIVRPVIAPVSRFVQNIPTSDQPVPDTETPSGIFPFDTSVMAEAATQEIEGSQAVRIGFANKAVTLQSLAHFDDVEVKKLYSGAFAKSYASLSPTDVLNGLLAEKDRYHAITPEMGAIKQLGHRFYEGITSSLTATALSVLDGGAKDFTTTKDAPSPTRDEWLAGYAPFGVPYDPSMNFAGYEWRKMHAIRRNELDYQFSNVGRAEDSLVFRTAGILSDFGGGFVGDFPLLVASFGAAAPEVVWGTASRQVVNSTARVLSRRWFSALSDSTIQGLKAGVWDTIAQDQLMQVEADQRGYDISTDDRIATGLMSMGIAGAFGAAHYAAPSLWKAGRRATEVGVLSRGLSNAIKTLDTGINKPANVDAIAGLLAQDGQVGEYLNGALQIQDRIATLRAMPEHEPALVSVKRDAARALLEDARSFVRKDLNDAMRLHPLTAHLADALDTNDANVLKDSLAGIYAETRDMPTAHVEFFTQLENAERVTPAQFKEAYFALTKDMGVPDVIAQIELSLSAAKRTMSASPTKAERVTITERILGAFNRNRFGEDLLTSAESLAGSDAQRRRMAVTRDQFRAGSTEATAPELVALGEKYGRTVRILDAGMSDLFRGATWNTDPSVIYLSKNLTAPEQVSTFFHELVHTVNVTNPQVAAALLEQIATDRGGLLNAVLDAREAYKGAWNELNSRQQMNEVMGHYLEKNAPFVELVKNHPTAAAQIMKTSLDTASVHMPSNAAKILKALGDQPFARAVADHASIMQITASMDRVYADVPAAFRRYAVRGITQEERLALLADFDAAKKSILLATMRSEKAAFAEGGATPTEDLVVKRQKPMRLAESKGKLAQRFPVGRQVPIDTAIAEGLLPFKDVKRAALNTKDPATSARAVDILKEFDYFKDGEKLRIHWDEKNADLAFMDKDGEQVRPDSVAVTGKTAMRQIPGIRDGKRFSFQSVVESSLRLNAERRPDFAYMEEIRSRLAAGAKRGDVSIPEGYTIPGYTFYTKDLKEAVAQPRIAFNKKGEGFVAYDFVGPDGKRVMNEADILWFERTNTDDSAARLSENKEEPKVAPGDEGDVQEGGGDISAELDLANEINAFDALASSVLESKDAVDTRTLEDAYRVLRDHAEENGAEHLLVHLDAAHDDLQALLAEVEGDDVQFRDELSSVRGSDLFFTSDTLPEPKMAAKDAAPKSFDPMLSLIEKHGSPMIKRMFAKVRAAMASPDGEKAGKAETQLRSMATSFGFMLKDAVTHASLLHDNFFFNGDLEIDGLKASAAGRQVADGYAWMNEKGGRRGLMRQEALRWALKNQNMLKEREKLRLLAEGFSSKVAAEGAEKARVHRPDKVLEADKGPGDGSVVLVEEKDLSDVAEDLVEMLGDETRQQIAVDVRNDAVSALFKGFKHDEKWIKVLENYMETDGFGERADLDDYDGMLTDLVDGYLVTWGEAPAVAGLPKGMSVVMDKLNLQRKENVNAAGIQHLFGAMSASPASGRDGVKKGFWQAASDKINGLDGPGLSGWDAKRDIPEPSQKLTRGTALDRYNHKVEMLKAAGVDLAAGIPAPDSAKRPGERAVYTRLKRAVDWVQVSRGKTDRIVSDFNKASIVMEKAQKAGQPVPVGVFEMLSQARTAAVDILMRADTPVAPSGPKGLTSLISEGWQTYRIENKLGDITMGKHLSTVIDPVFFLKEIVDTGQAYLSAAAVGREAKNLQVINARESAIQGFIKAGVDKGRAVGADTTGRFAKMGNFSDNVSARIKQHTQENWAPVENTLLSVSRLRDVASDAVLGQGIMEGIMTGKYPGPIEEQIGVALDRNQRANLERLNELGGNIRDTKHWFGASLFHEKLLRGMDEHASAPPAWISRALQSYDWDTMSVNTGNSWLKTDVEARTNYLLGMWEEFRMNNMDSRFEFDPFDSEGLASRSHHRNVVLKPEMAFEYVREFDNDSPGYSMVRSAQQLAHRVAVIEEWGFNPVENANAVADRLGLETGLIAGPRETLLLAVKEMTGQLSVPVNPKLKTVGDNITRAVRSTFFLPFGTSVFIGDFASQISTLQQQGAVTGIFDRRFWGNVKDAWTNRADPARRADFNRYLGMQATANAIKATADSLTGGFTGKLSSFDQFVFNITGMNAFSRVLQETSVQSLRVQYAFAAREAAAGRTWDASWGPRFEQAGLSHAEMASLGKFVESGKKAGLSAEILDPASLPDEFSDIRRKLTGHLQTALLSTNIEPDAITKGMLTLGMPRGTPGGEMAHVGTQFLGFTMSVPARTWSRFIHNYGPEGFKSALGNPETRAAHHLMTFIAAGFVFGYAAYAIGSIESGEEPKMVWELDHHDMSIVLAHSGMGGILTRFLTSHGRVGDAAGKLAVGKSFISVGRAANNLGTGRVMDAMDNLGDQFVPLWAMLSGMMSDTAQGASRRTVHAEKNP